MLFNWKLCLVDRLLEKQKENDGFSLIELVVVVAVLAVLSAIAIPSFICFPKRARATAALAALRQIKTECALKEAEAKPEIFTLSALDGYKIQSSGSNSCAGSNGVISALPDNTNELPTFNLAAATGSLTYKFKGMKGTNLKGCLGLICGKNIFMNKSDEIKRKYNIHDFVVKDAVINNGCSDYAIIEASSWQEAQKKSQDLGGNLVTINNKEEYSWLQQEVWGKNKLLIDSGDSSDESTYFFTGLNDVNQEGKYVWASGEESEFQNNEDLIHRQNWIAQQHMASSNDYFVIGGTNDVGFTDYTHDEYRPDLYSGTHGQLTWVDNESTWLKNNGNPRHFGLAEIPSC